jgi:hypothetical protein
VFNPQTASRRSGTQEETTMKRSLAIAAALLFVGFALSWSSHHAAGQAAWVVLFDGKNLDNWTPIGDANWRIEDGAVVADKGNGFLVSKSSYADFQIKVEFWADEDANSGIFIRCADPQKITAASCYEVNIYDKRPEPMYGTGAIVNVGKVDPMPKAAGKWNTYEITAKGAQLTVVLNGTKTVDVQDGQHKSGPFALQYAPGVVKDKGVIKFRKVEIRPL